MAPSLPDRAESLVDQAVSPGGVKTRRLWIYTGYLPANNKATGKFSGCISHIQGDNSQVAESRYLEEFSSKILGFIGLNDIFG